MINVYTILVGLLILYLSYILVLRIDFTKNTDVLPKNPKIRKPILKNNANNVNNANNANNANESTDNLFTNDNKKVSFNKKIYVKYI